ncbi:MAG: type II secretion system protein GspK [Kiritimatiellae bacterium]|nr:type II secretion system protein GspK [Kiritimatiellia bacterium]MDD4735240.1 type II secretion system protein GspK [Kiritimatiellia bacterium]
MTPLQRTSKKTGIILLPVLIILGLAAALTINMLFLSRLRLRERESILHTAQLHAALTDAALQAMQRLADDEDLQADHPKETWAQSLEYTTPTGISLWIGITDQNSKFDLNNVWFESTPNEQLLAQDALMDMLTYLGDYNPVDRIQALADWVDPDEDGFRESDWYEENDLSNRCPNAWLNTISELTRVAGFSKDYLTNRHEWARSSSSYTLRDYLAVIPGSRRSPVPINVNTAPPALLRAVAGIGQDTWVDYLLTFRANGALTSLDPLMAIVDASKADYLRKILDVRSTVYAIHVRAFQGDHTARLLALVRRDPTDGGVQVLQWML